MNYKEYALKNIHIYEKLLVIALSIVLGIIVFWIMSKLSGKASSITDIGSNITVIGSNITDVNSSITVTDSSIIVIGGSITGIGSNISGNIINNTAISELVQLRLRGFTALAASAIFTVNLQQFALKTVGDKMRVDDDAGVPANQIRRQIMVIWGLMLTNIFWIVLLSIFVIYIYGGLTINNAFWESESFQNALFGFISGGITASTLFALIDIRRVYFEKFAAKRNNDNG